MRRLTPRADSVARRLLDGASLADVSDWADQVRHQRPETAPLHYVNIPLAADDYDPARDCPGGACVIAAIEADRLTLADTSAPGDARAEALRFLVHLVADLHQPLHVSNDDDRGGNERRVSLQGRSMSLHQLWDGELLRTTGLDEDQYLGHLTAMMDTLDLTAFERGSVTDWALEGHRIARESAYRLPPDGVLDDQYVAGNLPLAELALIKAGVRLAMMLNAALQ